MSSSSSTPRQRQRQAASRTPIFATPPPGVRPTDIDEESPATTTAGGAATPATPWLDEPFFSDEHSSTVGNEGEGDDGSSFWHNMWAAPSPLRPVARRLAPHESWVASKWNNGIASLKLVLLGLTVVLLWPYGAFSFVDFTHATDSTFHTIPNTLSASAQEAFQRSYLHDWNDPMHPIMVVVLESTGELSLTNKTSTAYHAAKVFATELTNTLNHTCWKILKEQECQDTAVEVRVQSHYSFIDEGLAWLASGLATPDGKTVLIAVEYQLASETHTRERTTQLQQTIVEVGTAHNNANQNSTSDLFFAVSYTGIKFFASDLAEATQADLKRMDALVLPLALVLLGIVLPRAHPGFVWIIPLFTMISTVCFWSVIMSQFVAKSVQITHFTPSIMMSLTLGMGIDYTLFLLSRFLEKITTNQEEKHEAIRHMIQHGGHVVLLSGLTLMCTFLGLCFLPLDMMQSVGIGAAVSIACSLVVNLTIVPALLHTRLGDWIVQKQDSNSRALETQDDGQDDFDPLQNIGVIRSDSFDGEEQVSSRTLPDSLWTKLASHLLHPYKSIIIMLGISQLLLPVTKMATQVSTSISFDLVMPSTSPALNTFESLGAKMGLGRLAPYRILFDSHDANHTIDSQVAFDIMHTVIDELIAIDHAGESNGITHIATDSHEVSELTNALMEEMGMSAHAHLEQEQERQENLMSARALELAQVGLTQYSGIAVLKNARIPFSLYNAAKLCNHMKPYCPIEVLHLLDYVDSVATSHDKYATFVTATLGVNPFSDDGTRWLQDARETIDRLEKSGLLSGIKVHIQGSAAIAVDAVDSVLDAFPTVIGLTMLVVFVLMGLFFGSIVAPLRSVVSISTTLAFVFGLAVLVYQHGILNWTHARAWMSTGDEMSWLVPIMSFSIIVGLALDYDIFLVKRILEFRIEHKYGHKSSIVAGLDATGGIITAAGLIMAVAFGGLMMSASPVLYQWSFLLTTAVVFDTFVIRTLVVPIVLGWTGRWSWWPLKLPEARVHLLGFEEDVAQPDLTEPLVPRTL
jgi:uncharacterized membrane protein YdfJ with MMPL/SSD domain